MTLAALLGQIPLSPPLNVRLIALVVVEVVLSALVVVLWLKYEQLKTVSVDEWWERRKQAGVSRRVERMMRESHEALAGRAGPDQPRAVPRWGRRNRAGMSPVRLRATRP